MLSDTRSSLTPLTMEALLLSGWVVLLLLCTLLSILGSPSARENIRTVPLVAVRAVFLGAIKKRFLVRRYRQICLPISLPVVAGAIQVLAVGEAKKGG